MSSEIGDRRPARLPAPVNGTRPSEPENLPCPRCDSTNTKFCYYNNYNLSQPRHFCKSCRRYWTRGGTLRNVPVGGGTRKNSSHKRPRINSSTGNVQEHANSITMMGSESGLGSGSGSMSLMGCEVNLNESVHEGGNGTSSFTSLLTAPVGVGGFVPLGGFGLGLGGFGLGNLDWPMEQVGGGGNGGDGGENDKWQLSGGEMEGGGGGGGGGIGGDDDCFGWPDLAISAPGTSLK